MPATRPRYAGVHRASCPLRAGGGTTFSSPPHSVGCLTQHATHKTPLCGCPPRLLPIAGGGTTFSAPPQSVGCLTKHGGFGRRPTSPIKPRRLRPPSSVAPHQRSAQPGGIPTSLGRNKCVWLCSELLAPRGTDAVYKYPPGTVPPTCCSGRHLRTPLT